LIFVEFCVAGVTIKTVAFQKNESLKTLLAS